VKVVFKSRVTWATSAPTLVFLRLSVLDLSRVQTDRFQVPTTCTGSRLPETGQCVLSSGCRF